MEVVDVDRPSPRNCLLDFLSLSQPRRLFLNRLHENKGIFVLDSRATGIGLNATAARRLGALIC